MIAKPSVAKFKFNLDSNTELSRQLITSPGHELVGAILTSGGTASAARIYDSKDGNNGPKDQSILLAANAGESVPFGFAQPIPLDNGLYIEIEQGQGAGCELFVLYN